MIQVPYRSKSLRESLVSSGLLTEEAIKGVVEEEKKSGSTLIKAILQKNLLDEKTLLSFLEKEMEIPHVDLANYLVDPKAVDLVPADLAKKLKIIPLFKVGEILTIATLDPFDVVALDEIRKKTKCDIEPMVAGLQEIESAINQYYGVSGTVDDLVKSIEPVKKTAAKIAPSKSDEAPVSKLVSMLILRAVSEKASDIHIDPTEKNIRIRFRIDGILHDISTAPAYLHSSVVNRIKIMSELDIAESRVPQDGRFELKVEDKGVDVRVSTYPSIYGESIVMRLLDKSNILLSLEQVGFSGTNKKMFDEVIKRPYGIILVTGPTGSGKTTTLYATLNQIISPEINIMTIEDPVEYELAGVRQAQVNVKAGLEFSTALRSMLRQDPDVILVGEIRDEETAKVAIQSALTGHLVFSTLHTNDAAGTLNRLIDMGVEPFLITSSVASAIAQRLVRTICPNCKEGYTPQKELLEKLGSDKKDVTFYRGKGCKNCRSTGYRGRTGIFEILILNDKIKELVGKRAPTHEIKQAALEAGMKTLQDDGLQKVFDGVTTIEEVLRVTQLE